MMRQDWPLWLGELSPSYVGMLVGVLASLHPIQLPANISGKAVDNGPYTWAPLYPTGEVNLNMARVVVAIE